ncbi:hypothetical protein B0H13DRAFT_1850981 [Mycena leptocephala]|nr:hypothetical protein B0H13DRAFT_1850981 [Mycena leptocephala]
MYRASVYERLRGHRRISVIRGTTAIFRKFPEEFAKNSAGGFNSLMHFETRDFDSGRRDKVCGKCKHAYRPRDSKKFQENPPTFSRHGMIYPAGSLSPMWPAIFDVLVDHDPREKHTLRRKHVRGDGVSGGIGGSGGVGEGARFLIEKFSGTQIIIDSSEINREINRKIDEIQRHLGIISEVPRGVSGDLFWVMDPVGGYIPVSLQYCHDYPDLDEHIKTSLRCSPRPGASYVERGDYSVVSEDGSFIVPVEFAQMVGAGMLLEISILQRQVQKRSDAIQNNTCPSCGCSQATTTGNEWFKCTTCERNYRIGEQDEDLEEIVSPQLAQPNEEAERKLFRRIHIYIAYAQKEASLPLRPMYLRCLTQLRSSANRK